MKYESSQSSPKSIIERVFSIVNFILIIIIVFCINYMVVDFLF